ncbi:deduced tail fiber protein [Stenotrophomonas maltophilia]|nr:hypothetical protein XY58_09865 [Stenotrophomonas maltophilia]MBA0255768.1 hypothetical protein [Stenotrophomonas maltophilia]MBA0452133.1 hypothetical protein [Stenotrophomonas maltophilia]MBA0480413.1 hypothetical protein [Stenotrophomonas maltophilia]MBA0489697.1 hypothetical protein [Stenotrophomonas maltophilia]
MALRTPLILNQSSARIEELAVADSIPGALIDGLFGRNIIINGDFRFWQRGQSFDAIAYATYTADRFLPVMVNDTVTVNRAEHPPGDVPNVFNSRYFMRCGIGQVAGNNSLATLQYRVENGHRLLSGKTITVSMLVRASSATKLGMEIEITYGTGGSPSPSIYGNSQLVTGITGGWQLITRTFTIASSEGKTFGTSTDGYLSLILWMDAGSDWNSRSAGVGRQTGEFQFSNIQIESGNGATPFEQRPDSLELLLCQQYYEKSYNLSVVPGTATNEGRRSVSLGAAPSSFTFIGQAFAVRKRGIPSITVYPAPGPGPSGAGNVAQDDGSLRPVTVQNIGSSGFEMTWSNSPGRYGGWFHWVADAEI